MLLKSRCLAWAVAAALAVGSSASAGVIIVDPDAGTSQANLITTGNVAGDRTERSGSQITNGTDLDLTYSGPNNNFANATFAFNDSGLFISDIDNRRTAGGAAQQHVRIAFMVDVPTLYTFSGEYINSNFVDFSGRAFLQNALTDRTTLTSVIPTTSVFSSSFAAGPVLLNIATRTGLLTAGHTYVWDVFVGSLASGNPAGSTGSGDISLAFTPLPEPTSLLLGSMGVAGVGLLRRRRK